MKTSSRLALRAAGIAVLALALPLPALADCVDTRKATAAEREFHGRAVAALVAALPPVPVGGKLQNKDSVPTLGDNQCVGATGDFSVQATRYYELNSRLAIVEVEMNRIQLPAAGALVSTYGSASPKRSAGLKVSNVMARVSGSDSPLRQALVDGIDRARLEAMVGKPLPSVAESQALAARAVPATVAGTLSSPAASAPGASGTAAQPAAPASPSAPAPAQAGASAPSKTRPIRSTSCVVCSGAKPNASHHPVRYRVHPARPLTRGEWRSAAEVCAGTLLETPPHPRAGGECFV